MSAKLSKTLKEWGLTPWQGLVAVFCVVGWFYTFKPLPGEMAKISETVNVLSTRVAVQEVLLQAMADTRKEVDGLRTEIARIQGKLHANSD